MILILGKEGILHDLFYDVKNLLQNFDASPLAA